MIWLASSRSKRKPSSTSCQDTGSRKRKRTRVQFQRKLQIELAKKSPCERKRLPKRPRQPRGCDLPPVQRFTSATHQKMARGGIVSRRTSQTLALMFGKTPRRTRFSDFYLPQNRLWRGHEFSSCWSVFTIWSPTKFTKRSSHTFGR